MRAFQISARSASLAATRVSVDPLAAQMSMHLAEERARLDRRPVELDDQRGAAVRIPGVDDLLACLDREAIHHLDGGRRDARGDDSRDRLARVAHRGERREHRLRRLGNANDAEHHLGHDAERPLAADHHAEQVIAGGIAHRPAELRDLAVGGDEGRRENVVRS